MTNWQIYWSVVGCLIVALIVPAELIAVFTNVHNTLSWSVWDLEGFIPGGHKVWTWVHWVVGSFFMLLFLWLAFHFSLGWLR